MSILWLGAWGSLSNIPAGCISLLAIAVLMVALGIVRLMIQVD
jgi:hypothetical protein